MEPEHLRMLKEAIEEIENKIADLKAIVSLIEVWEGKGEGKMNENEYTVKLQYTVNTPKPATIVVTVMCEGESEEAKKEVDDFAKILDSEVRGFLERKYRGEIKSETRRNF